MANNNWTALGKVVELCKAELEGANKNHGNDEWEIVDDKQNRNHKVQCPNHKAQSPVETVMPNQPALTAHKREPEKPSAPPKPHSDGVEQFKTVLEVLQKSLEKSLRVDREEREIREQFYKEQSEEELAAQKAAQLQKAVDRYRWLSSDIHAQPNELRDLYKKIISSVNTPPPYPPGLYCSLCWLGDGYLEFNNVPAFNTHFLTVHSDYKR